MSSDVAAVVIDKGAKPHFPPFPYSGEGDDVAPALELWVRRGPLRITDPIELRRATRNISLAIGARGLPERKLFTNAFDTLRPKIEDILQRTVDRAIKEANLLAEAG